MKYLDKVVRETLRKYPALPTLQRTSTQNYQLPNKEVIEKGTNVFVSLLGHHNDEEFYPDPEKFDPERFSDENKKSVDPVAYLPFGEGPRKCIGLRFAVMQVKVGLSVILKKYKVLPHESLKYPMEFHSKTIFLCSKDTVLLNIERV